MLFKDFLLKSETILEKKISDSHYLDEKQCILNLISHAEFEENINKKITNYAKQLIIHARNNKKKIGNIDIFLTEYNLSNEEGIALMCLAEALLRIPDKETSDRFIKDKICKANWKNHINQSDSIFINAATWGLLITGKIIKPSYKKNLSGIFKNFLIRTSKGSIRLIIRQAMKILSRQFVLGEDIQESLEKSQEEKSKGYYYSYDMLGESAKTEKDSELYYQNYLNTIDIVGKNSKNINDIYQKPNISIKLSALFSRYEFSQLQRVMKELYSRVKHLAMRSKKYNITLTIDAEEASQLEISLQIIEKLALDKDLINWNGLGLAVQSYQKRAYSVIDWLINLSHRSNKRLIVRLVKGAYWDSEIKIAQTGGFENYPVFTRKSYTDISYIACAKKMLFYKKEIFSQFATHNAYTIASILEFSDGVDFEFQCLHGMGSGLYDQIVQSNNKIPCRIYAPFGNHKHLLAYLVRRLLENGANTSFIYRIRDKKISPEKLIENPIIIAKKFDGEPHPNIPLPKNIYKTRINAKGIDINNRIIMKKLIKKINFATKRWESYPLIAKINKPNRYEKYVLNPENSKEIIGTIIYTDPNEVDIAIERSLIAFSKWKKVSVIDRIYYLQKMGNLLENNMENFIALLIKEAGKTIPNAISEIREAINFCRYYAEEAKKLFSSPIEMIGPTGEKNSLYYHGRGIIACISPWNFPLAIFLGGIVASIVAGNTVIAKPAEQTSLIAHKTVQLLYKSGIPKDVVQCLPGDGNIIGEKIINDVRINSVIFTGSNDTAKRIFRLISKKSGIITNLIAETGGQNALIVDSSALLEQVTTDIIYSAFNNSGQRCSSLRVLFVQNDIADNLISMIKGAMKELTIGDPKYLSTDIGPIIDQESKKKLLDYISYIKLYADMIYQVDIKNNTNINGNFFPPTIIEINNINLLKEEIFGPILHIIRFNSYDLKKIINQINNMGYGLTAGVHTRVNNTAKYICDNLNIGNIYINRNQIGAEVGVQPFGGEGLSGTGPKTGGPNYLVRLSYERTISINTTATGGNTVLLSLE